FTVLRWANTACTGASSNIGSCYTKEECQAIGGAEDGSCAMGYGVCCYKAIRCGQESSTNCTYLVSPHWPGTYNQARECTMRIHRMPDTCQLRMDFVDFNSVQPDDTGICNEDQFSVSGEIKFTHFCGSSPADWHFYLDVANKADPTEFKFLTSTANYDRRFKIKITMIPCAQKIPCGCGQYFRGNTGIIQSWNYPGTYPAGVNYGICFRKEKGKCTTTLTRAGPSFVSCAGNDLYRQPLGQSNGDTVIAGLNTLNLYCQLNCIPGVAFIDPVCTMPTPVTTVNNGPMIIHHNTNIDGFTNQNNGVSGFYQTFEKNNC
ncbi:unnamed protein product, partial [Meganyctiphanes norvegica]